MARTNDDGVFILCDNLLERSAKRAVYSSAVYLPSKYSRLRSWGRETYFSNSVCLAIKEVRAVGIELAEMSEANSNTHSHSLSSSISIRMNVNTIYSFVHKAFLSKSINLLTPIFNKKKNVFCFERWKYHYRFGYLSSVDGIRHSHSTRTFDALASLLIQ